MPKVTDEELDRLFREAAESTHPEFDPGDWDDMSQKLAREEKAAKARNRTLYSVVTLLVLYSMWSPFGDRKLQTASMNPLDVSEFPAKDNLNDSETTKVMEESEVSDRPEATPAIAPVADPGDRTVALIDEVAGPSKSKGRNDTNMSSTENPPKENVAVSKNRTLPTVKNEVVGINKGAESSGAENEEGVDNGGFKSLEEKVLVEDHGYANQQETTHEFPALAITRDRKLPLLLGMNNKKKVISVVKVERPALTQVETVVNKDALQSNHPWYIRLPVSPDFSSIDYGSTGKTGINIGLIGEYYLTKHISVSAGAIWSKKLYDQDNPDKMYYAGTWSAKVNRLDGDCRILDIPLNVTYYLFSERRTNFFVTVGSSSYIMLNEDYRYTVWKNQQYVTYDQQVSHKNNEWFSMLNVSIGIQQRVGQRFLFQVEPFLKAPMSGVGEGKVNLVSTGAFVSLKYQLTK